MDFPNRSRRLNHSVPRKASVGESVAENIPEVGEIPDKVRNEVDVRNTVPLENVAGKWYHPAVHPHDCALSISNVTGRIMSQEATVFEKGLRSDI